MCEPQIAKHCISSAASDVYKRQVSTQSTWGPSLWFIVLDVFTIKNILKMQLLPNQPFGLIRSQRLNLNHSTPSLQQCMPIMTKYQTISTTEVPMLLPNPSTLKQGSDDIIVGKGIKLDLC
eukprot:TRINITY_DN35118_c0_g1_i1.p2 TRINITY_DN35118_c0_g1~~TRINITY_DN35118_c0_g1_i1.p2  ORF type:complete len:121 (+),score=16.80 TRINITY_DN35118_c0_g1_i1:43-405(+)